MKEIVPTSSVAGIMLDDDEVMEIRWCRACNRGRQRVASVSCPSCDGLRVVKRVVKDVTTPA